MSREIHWCEACPKWPGHRPPTKREVVEWWNHHYRDRPLAWRMRMAVEDYTHKYATWVNTKGWRKPPDWSGGPVAAHDLRPARATLLPDDVARWRRELMEKLRRSLDDRSNVQ